MKLTSFRDLFEVELKSDKEVKILVQDILKNSNWDIYSVSDGLIKLVNTRTGNYISKIEKKLTEIGFGTDHEKSSDSVEIYYFDPKTLGKKF